MINKTLPVLVPHETVICRFHLRSTCREGDQCYFSHDTETAFIPDRVCRYFLKHKCEYGPLCKFEHVRIQRPAGFMIKHKRRPKRNVAKKNIESEHPLSDCKDETKGEKSPKKKDSSDECSDETKENISINPENSEDKAAKFRPSPTAKYIPPFGWYDPEVLLRNFSYGDTSPSDLCTYYMCGPCPFDDRCPYTHGYVCELCGFAVLSPTNEEQRVTHIEECEKSLIEDMELSFAFQRSKDKTCGVCMEVVFDKSRAEERRFGILENCNHVFCLTCIRKWRKTKEERTDSDPVNTRSCPHCRIPSDFIVPSSYWFETEKDKEKLIVDFKETMSKRPCKYFRKGEGTCPFGAFCFYLHALPDGTKVSLPPPSRKRRRRNNVDDMESIALAVWLQQLDREGLSEFEISDVLNDL